MPDPGQTPGQIPRRCSEAGMPPGSHVAGQKLTRFRTDPGQMRARCGPDPGQIQARSRPDPNQPRDRVFTLLLYSARTHTCSTVCSEHPPPHEGPADHHVIDAVDLPTGVTPYTWETPPPGTSLLLISARIWFPCLLLPYTFFYLLLSLFIIINRRSGIASHTSHGHKTGTRSMQPGQLLRFIIIQ